MDQQISYYKLRKDDKLCMVRHRFVYADFKRPQKRYGKLSILVFQTIDLKSVQKYW